MEGGGALIDIFAWSQAQAAAIRARRWNTVDADAVAEEIEDMGSEIKTAIESYLAVILEHMLKLRFFFSPDDERGWLQSIDNSQQQIARRLRRNPSLAGFPAEVLADAYADAKRSVERFYGGVPDICPWTIDEVLGQS